MRARAEALSRRSLDDCPDGAGTCDAATDTGNTAASAVYGWERGVTPFTFAWSDPASLPATVTNESVRELGLAEGRQATALIKASHVILAVPA